MEHDGNPIIEFVALAPKTYAYKYLDMKAKIPSSDIAQIEALDCGKIFVCLF